MLAALAALLAGCGSAGFRAGPSDTTAVAGDTRGDEIVDLVQSLYRLSYEGEKGRVGLRVVLRQGLDDRFQMTASDLAGRRVWGIEHRPDRVVLVDHREKRYCIAGADFHLEDLHPRELPLAALPRVLAGELPFAPPPDLPEEWIDDEGARWRASYEEGVLTSWLLYGSRGPALWWSLQQDGAVLSRPGEQYRWTRVASERVRAEWLDPVPGGYEEGVCDG